ncbi:uncharacterized protein LOC144359233 [Saccoglossus kowalevskii]
MTLSTYLVTPVTTNIPTSKNQLRYETNIDTKRDQARNYDLQSLDNIGGNYGTQYSIGEQTTLISHYGVSMTTNNHTKSNIFDGHIPQSQHTVDIPITRIPTEIESTKSGDDYVKYIFGLQRYGTGGQNAQYSGFVNAVLFALITNRTLVMTPFFVHGGHVMHGYNREHMKEFNDTFNKSRLDQLVRLTTVQHYKSTCNESNSMVLTWCDAKYHDSSTTLFNIFGLQLPGELTVLKKNISQQELDDLVGGVQCLVFYQTHKFRIKVSNKEDALMNIRMHLERSPDIKRVTDTALNGVCQRPFLALHFRNKSAEMPCFFHYNKTRCDNIKRRVLSLVENITTAVAEIMKSNNLSCLYVSCPLWSRGIIDNLAQKIPRDRIFTSDDLTRDANSIPYYNDYYFLSLVEQEICYRSSIFIASTWSTWSTHVRYERISAGRQTFYLNELPGITFGRTKLV